MTDPIPVLQVGNKLWIQGRTADLMFVSAGTGDPIWTLHWDDDDSTTTMATSALAKLALHNQLHLVIPS